MMRVPFMCSSVGRAVLVAVLSLVLSCASSRLVAAYGQVPGHVEEELDRKYSEYFEKTDANTSAGKVLWDIRSGMLRFLQVVLGVAALGALVLACYNMLSGEQSGAKRLFLWGAGLVLGWTLLSVFSNVGMAGYVEGEGFAGLQGTVAEVLEISLSIICMVTLVVVAVHIMNGERDGMQKFIRWLTFSGAGLLLMEFLRNKV